MVLTPIPQADGRTKNRPAVVLREMPPYSDLLVCGVSTQLDQQVGDFDELRVTRGFRLAFLLFKIKRDYLRALVQPANLKALF